MKNYFKLFQVGIMMLTIMILASCSTEKSELTAIPNDAGFVLVVDGKALHEKANTKNVTESEAYKKLLNKFTTEELKDFKQFEYIFEDPKESGIAIDGEFIAFVKMEEGEPVLGVNFLVTDKSKVDSLFAKVVDNEKTDVKIITEDGISFITDKDDHAVIAWNEHQLLMYAQQDVAGEALVNAAKTLLNQTTSKSIFANSIYTDFYANKKDISVWFNYDLFLDNMPPAQQMMMSSSLPFSFKGTYFYAYTSFEKGQVVVEYESIMNDEMKDYLKKYQMINDDFDTDVLKMLPKTSYANFEMSLNLYNYYHMFLDMYKEKQVNTDMYTKQIEDELGMTLDDLLNSFSGEMAISLHGFEIDSANTKLEPLFSAIIKYNSDELWDILEKRAGEMGFKKENGYYTIDMAHVYLAYVNSTMVISNDESYISDLIKNGSVDPNMESTDIAKHLGDFPAYMEIDMNLDNYQTELQDLLKQQGNKYSPELYDILNTYQRLQVLPTSNTSAKMVLQLKDDSKNSLEVIINSMSDAVDVLSEN